MSREIRFRVWDKFSEQWEDDVIIYQDGSAAVWENSPEPSYVSRDDEEVVIERYTGLDDKNGTPIYEGDIVKARWYRAKHARLDTQGKVKFGNGWFYINDDPDGQDRLGVPVHNCYSIVVIGNIHENGELLGG